jgi:hypothetical protein
MIVCAGAVLFFVYQSGKSSGIREGQYQPAPVSTPVPMEQSAVPTALLPTPGAPEIPIRLPQPVPQPSVAQTAGKIQPNNQAVRQVQAQQSQNLQRAQPAVQNQAQQPRPAVQNQVQQPARQLQTPQRVQPAVQNQSTTRTVSKPVVAPVQPVIVDATMLPTPGSAVYGRSVYDRQGVERPVVPKPSETGLMPLTALPPEPFPVLQPLQPLQPLQGVSVIPATYSTGVVATTPLSGSSPTLAPVVPVQAVPAQTPIRKIISTDCDCGKSH